ncbi:MAG: class II fructose-bisphosphate aldolase [Candidatus Aenigmarchaeota archaeon]|nr:class II fructose-bisphosphate aldolase [Candidatus Aenigmarchaeota archaeon]
MDHLEYFSSKRNPLSGDLVFDALFPPKEIILAANARVSMQIIEGILKAAKETQNVVILEMALSEMNLDGGYCGVTPKTYANRVSRAAKNVGWYGYVLHADHLTVKKGTRDEIENLKKEIDARVNAKFSSFAIDTSLLFDNTKGKSEDRLKKVIKNYVILFKHLKGKLDSFGKEGEVGEIGIKEFTRVEDAIYFLEKLKENDIELNWLAISNGSKHGISVDENGNIIPNNNINIKITEKIADEISKKYKTRIVQHGTTGTPIDFIEKKFPKGKISKCNVATHWMLLVWDILKTYEPKLYKKIYDWTIEKYKSDSVCDAETFAKNSKYAIKHFFDEIENISDAAKSAIRKKSYEDALIFFKAFGMKKTAKKVYEHMNK